METDYILAIHDAKQSAKKYNSEDDFVNYLYSIPMKDWPNDILQVSVKPQYSLMGLHCLRLVREYLPVFPNVYRTGTTLRIELVERD